MWHAKLLMVSLDRIYLWLCVPVLVAMVYILPPFQSPDEVAHFYRATQLSHGEFMPVLVHNSYRPAAGGAIDESALRFVAHYCGEPTWFCPGQDRPATAEIFRGGGSDTSKDPRRLTAFSNTAIYLPVAHLVPAFAIGFARELGLGAAGWFYAGRLANALFAMAATWLALRLLRKRRSDLLVFTIATLPMTLSVAATLSADAGVISCSFLLFAICLRLLDEQGARAWLWAALLIAVLYAAAAKIAYLPLAILPSVCLFTAQAPRRLLFGTLMVAAVVVAGTLAWSSLTESYVFPISHDSRVEIAGQIAFLRAHPVGTLSVLVKSMTEEAPLGLFELVGWKLSGYNVVLPLALLAVPTLSLIAAVALGGSDEPRAALRVFVMILVLASASSTFLFLYIQNSGVGSNRVQGYQGRYFLPILPFAGLVIPAWNSNGTRLARAVRALMIGSSCLTVAALALFLALRPWQ